MVKLNSIVREQNVTFVNNLDLYIQPGAYQFNLLTAVKMGIHWPPSQTHAIVELPHRVILFFKLIIHKDKQKKVMFAELI